VAEVLSSWKEIAAYVGKGVRTVQRWERDLGFPVRRPSTTLRNIVVALPAEIDSWIAASARSNGHGSIEGNENELRQRIQELEEEVAVLRSELASARAHARYGSEKRVDSDTFLRSAS
jgi:hypothetical protein